MTASLKFGSVSLLPSEEEVEPSIYASLEAEYRITAAADSTSWGNAERIITAVRSHLQDGSLASVTAQDNREGTIKVRVESETYDGLAAGESALMAQTQVKGYNTLEWTPNVALARPTVFDVVYSYMDFDFDDFDETILRRTYKLTLALLPFGRSKDLITVQATSSGGSSTAPSYTLINDGGSLANWSGTHEVTQTDGYVQSRGGGIQVSPGTVNAYLTYDPSTFSMGGQPYLAVDYYVATASPDGTPPAVTVTDGDNTAQKLLYKAVMVAPSDRAGFSRAFYQIPYANVKTLRFEPVFTYVGSNSSDPYILRIDKIQRSATLPSIGTNRQRARSLTVPGSARARAKLIITADAGKTLGDLTMIYTRTATTGMQPPLRPFLVSSSSVTADPTSTISGGFNSMNSSMVFLVPANRLREAMFSLVLRMSSTAVGTAPITWSAALVSASNTDLPETGQIVSGVTTVNFPNTTYLTAEVGLLQLPTVPVAPDSANLIRLTISTTSNTLYFDEGWLFDLDNGVLSWVDSTGLTRLEARTADLTNPEPSYWGGSTNGGGETNLVRADYRVWSFGTHVFEPGVVDVLTVTSGTEGSACQASFYPCWHTHAGAVAA